MKNSVVVGINIIMQFSARAMDNVKYNLRNISDSVNVKQKISTKKEPLSLIFREVFLILTLLWYDN